MLAKSIFVFGIIYLLNSDVHGSQAIIFDPDLLQIQKLLVVQKMFDRALLNFKKESTESFVEQVPKKGLSDIVSGALLQQHRLVLECIEQRQEQVAIFYEGKMHILLESVQRKLLDNL